MTPEEFKKKLDGTLEFMAYEMCHSGGQEEVDGLAASLKTDLAWVYALFEEKAALYERDHNV
jgi:hypothetical protein